MRFVVRVTVCTVIAAAVVVGLHDDSPYCAVRYRRLCQGKGLHVGCQFPDPGPGAACVNYTPIKFQDNLKHFITHYLNRRRQRVAVGSERVRGGIHLPKPELMMMVEWDRELATLAQRLADQCHFAHDQCRATVRYPYAGQTVGEVRWRRSSGSDALTAQRAIRRVFDAWWGERRRVQPEQLTAPFRLTAKGAVWGHFSQLAVWSLRAVGCGAVRHGAHYPRLLLVCDFSHTNMLGQRTISPGPLARCPPHTERRLRSSYPLLCAPVRYPPPERNYEAESDEYSSDEEDLSTISRPFPPRDKTHVVTEKMIKKFTMTRTTDRSVDWWKKNAPQDVTLSQPRGALVYKLSRELEDRKKAGNKVMLYVDNADWRSRVAADEKKLAFRKRILNIDDEIEESSEDYGGGVTTVHDYAKPDTIQYKYSNTTDKYVARHKWHPTRDRPKRPGAKALLGIPTTVHTRRPIGSLRLDKEDIDQLFKDTGFNPSWLREHPVP